MANPQPTPFVQFSKELFDALLRSHMPATHKEIVLAVIRCTYGHHGRKSAPISQTLLQQMIGRHKNGIRQSLRELIAEGVIVQVSPPSFGASAVLALNKDYEAWGKWSVSYTVMEDPQDMGEVQQGVGGEVQQGVGGEVQQGVPIEDIETLEDSTTPRARLVSLARSTIPGWKPHDRDGPMIDTALLMLSEDHIERVIRKLAIDQAAKGRYTNLRSTLANWLKTEYPQRGGDRERVGAVCGRSENGEW